MADSTLYFVRRDFDGAIKIGITTDLRRRLPDPRRQHGGMTLFGTVAGASTREKLAHLIFADSRLDGEFFQPTSALLFFLA
jgi:predicted GIY-YIG superfamily endonuclease